MYKALDPDCIGHHVSIEEVAEELSLNGFEGVWFNIRREYPKDISRTRKILDQYGLKAAGFALPVEYRNDETTYEQDMENLRNYAKYASELGAHRCITWIIPYSDTLSYDENFELHKIRLKRAAEILAEFDISLGLEFLGPPKLRKGVKNEFIHTLDGMLELCRAIGTDNIGLLLDVWHWDLAGQKLADFSKIENESWIVAAHIMDAPSGIAPEEQEDLIRKLPGDTGVLKIHDFFKGLRSLNYSGPVIPEPFVADLADLPFREACAIVKKAVDSVWE